MPYKNRRPCKQPGCPNLVYNGYCEQHKRKAYDYDTRRGSAAQRGYDHRWRTYRESYLSKHPLCVECSKTGRIEAATVVDHIVPHKGDKMLFWDPDNHQPLCKQCHDKKTLSEGSFGNVR